MTTKTRLTSRHAKAVLAVLDVIGNSYAMHPASILAVLPKKIAERFIQRPLLGGAHFSSLNFMEGACADYRIKCSPRESGWHAAQDRTAALRAKLEKR